MSQLARSDLEGALRFISELGELDSLTALREALLPALRRLLPADVASYTEIDLATSGAGFWTAPGDVAEEADGEAFAEHFEQHPLARFHASDGGATAVQFSDFLSERELHALELYNDFYRPLGIEHQIAIALDAPGMAIPISLQRARGPFDQRTREMLELLHPYLTNVQRQLRALTHARQALAALNDATGQRGPALLLVTGVGHRIELSTGRSVEWLSDYFDGGDGGRHVPPELAAWIADQRRSPNGGRQLVTRRTGACLVVRYVPGTGTGDCDVVLLEERRTQPDPDSLRELGLTPRETEVLSIAAAGRTNAEIADELIVSPRTVQMHMQHVFEKLGVHTRTAAVARALGAAGPDSYAA